MALCAVDGCDKTAQRLSFCQMHYSRVRRTGAPGESAPRRITTPAASRLCSIEGCDGCHAARGLCRRHYQRWYQHGDPGEAERRCAPRGTNSSGDYLVKRRNGKTMLAHRVVMEQMLGRELTANENVHHINGIRTDNRPENLELWTRSQPSGQRVTDKVAWCLEFLRQYAPDSLVAH